MVYIKVTPEFGRGVYASRLITQGETVAVCEVLVLSADDTRVVNGLTDLQYYTFVYNAETGQDCLVLGHGEIFNHSDMTNVIYVLEEHNGRKQMIFSAICDIAEGEQLFIDYNADTKVDTSAYIGKNLL